MVYLVIINSDTTFDQFPLSYWYIDTTNIHNVSGSAFIIFVLMVFLYENLDI